MKYHHRGRITLYLDVATDAGDRAQGRLRIATDQGRRPRYPVLVLPNIVVCFTCERKPYTSKLLHTKRAIAVHFCRIRRPKPILIADCFKRRESSSPFRARISTFQHKLTNRLIDL